MIGREKERKRYRGGKRARVKGTKTRGEGVI